MAWEKIYLLFYRASGNNRQEILNTTSWVIVSYKNEGYIPFFKKSHAPREGASISGPKHVDERAQCVQSMWQRSFAPSSVAETAFQPICHGVGRVFACPPRWRLLFSLSAVAWGTFSAIHHGMGHGFTLSAMAATAFQPIRHGGDRFLARLLQRGALSPPSAMVETTKKNHLESIHILGSIQVEIIN